MSQKIANEDRQELRQKAADLKHIGKLERDNQVCTTDMNRLESENNKLTTEKQRLEEE